MRVKSYVCAWVHTVKGFIEWSHWEQGQKLHLIIGENNKQSDLLRAIFEGDAKALQSNVLL